MVAEHWVSKIHIKFKELDTKKMKMPLTFILIIYGNNIFGYSWLLKYCILIKLVSKINILQLSHENLKEPKAVVHFPKSLCI